MNELRVFLVSDLGEVYLGTVGELTGALRARRRPQRNDGMGISIPAAISDIVGDLAFGDRDENSTVIRIELRD